MAKNTLASFTTTVILKDGSTLHIRAVNQEDEGRLLGLLDTLSKRKNNSQVQPVLSSVTREEVRSFCALDYKNTMALAAAVGEGEGERIIAVGRYSRLPKRGAAEIAFLVEDKYQGKGIGTHLLEQLATIARDEGIRLFEAEIAADNQKMVRMFKSSGFRIAEAMDSGSYRMVMDITSSAVVEQKSAEREKLATIASLKAFVEPHSIAVIGASRRQASIGNRLFRNLLSQEFNGIAYPVNPNAEMVASVKSYPSILDITEEVDLAVVIVPAEAVQQEIEHCGRKGVKGIVVISAGFGESGAEGKESQERLVETARSYGMRLVGPNCMGIINTNPNVNMNATFSPIFPPPGNVAMGSQSGALGLAILGYTKSLNIGLSTFVSIGNRADVSNNDLLQYWEHDPATSVILLYLESFGNPRKFARIARRVTRTKPIVAVKSGRTPAGARAAGSHTGAMATAEVTSEALFQQAGILRVDTLEQLFDTANLLSTQPVPAGRKVAILTNGGGPGIMTADACVAMGLELAALSDKTISRLKDFLPIRASLTNPIDITAEATADQYRQALRLLVNDNQVDVVIVIFIPPVATELEAAAGAIREAALEYRRRGKTLVASFMGSRGTAGELSCNGEYCVPSFAFPEASATAIAKACEYNDWLQRPQGTIPEMVGINRKKGERIITSALEQGARQPFWLDSPSIAGLLNAYGIHTGRSKSATTAKAAVKAAEEIGFPVAVKLLSTTIAHKTEVDGVILDIRSPEEVERAFGKIEKRLGSVGRENEMQGVIVQQMISGGVEVITGVTQDPSFGPLVLFGMGGIYTELFKDVTFRIHPLTDVDAQEMVRSVKAYQLLTGWRGAAPSDVRSLEELLLRVSAMIEDLPQIAELDLNPVKVLEQGRGYVVVDARILTY